MRLMAAVPCLDFLPHDMHSLLLDRAEGKRSWWMFDSRAPQSAARRIANPCRGAVPRSTGLTLMTDLARRAAWLGDRWPRAAASCAASRACAASKLGRSLESSAQHSCSTRHACRIKARYVRCKRACCSREGCLFKRKRHNHTRMREGFRSGKSCQRRL